MWDMTEDLTALARIYITAFLNDSKMGIYDPLVGLSDTNKSAHIMKTAAEGKAALGGRQARISKIQTMLDDLSQSQFDNVPPRRSRGGSGKEVQAGEDQEGGSLLNNVTKRNNYEKLIDFQNKKFARRLAKTPRGAFVNAKGAVFGNVEMPAIVRNIRQIIKQNLGDTEEASAALILKRFDAALKVKANLVAEYDEKFDEEKNKDGSPKYKNEKEREKAVDDYVNSMLPEKLKLDNKDLFGYMNPVEQENLIISLRNQTNDKFVDFNFDAENPNYTEDFIKSMEEFWDEILDSDGGHAKIPKYDKDIKRFEAGDKEFSLQNFITDINKRKEPISPAQFVRMIHALYDGMYGLSGASVKNRQEINQDLKSWAPKIYRAVLRMAHRHEGESLQDIDKMLRQAGIDRADTAPVQQPQQQQPQPQPQPQQPQPQQQPQMAANVIDDLLNNLTKHVGHEDFIKLVDNLATKIEEFKNSPNRKEIAEKIRKKYEQVAKMRDDMFLADKFMYSPADSAAFNKLHDLYKALAI
jgi:hypothetical protein